MVKEKFDLINSTNKKKTVTALALNAKSEKPTDL